MLPLEGCTDPESVQPSVSHGGNADSNVPAGSQQRLAERCQRCAIGFVKVCALQATLAGCFRQALEPFLRPTQPIRGCSIGHACVEFMGYRLGP